MTRATAFASEYRLNLFSNFTYVLDDPERGDQFEQADRRWVTGGRVAHTRKMRWGDRLGENTVGVQLRNDDIPLVGLLPHRGPRPPGTITRQDDGEPDIGGGVRRERAPLAAMAAHHRRRARGRLSLRRAARTMRRTQERGRADS